MCGNLDLKSEIVSDLIHGQNTTDQPYGVSTRSFKLAYIEASKYYNAFITGIIQIWSSIDFDHRLAVFRIWIAEKNPRRKCYSPYIRSQTLIWRRISDENSSIASLVSWCPQSCVTIIGNFSFDGRYLQIVIQKVVE